MRIDGVSNSEIWVCQVHAVYAYMPIGIIFVTRIRTLTLLASHYKYIPFLDTYHTHINTKTSATPFVSLATMLIYIYTYIK